MIRHLIAGTAILIAGILLLSIQVSEANPKWQPVHIPTQPRIIAETIIEPQEPSLRELIERHWPAEHVEAAMRVMLCESNGNPDAIGDNGQSLGLFQIQPRWWSDRKPAGSPFHPAVNIEWAHRIWAEYGWRYWTCQP